MILADVLERGLLSREACFGVGTVFKHSSLCYKYFFFNPLCLTNLTFVRGTPNPLPRGKPLEPQYHSSLKAYQLEVIKAKP